MRDAMSNFTDGRQNDFIAQKVRERMASQQQLGSLKPSPSSPSPTPPAPRSAPLNDGMIVLSDDDDGDAEPQPPLHRRPALAFQHKPTGLISPRSPVEERPRTPACALPLSPLDTPQRPIAMPSLLQTAVNAAAPRTPVETPKSPVEDAESRKRKRQASPSPTFRGSTGPNKVHRTGIAKEEVDDRLAKSPRRSLESPASPVKEVDSRALPFTTTAEASPRSPVEDTAPSSQNNDIIATGLPAPSQSQKLGNEIKHTELAERYAPVTHAGVEYRNPAKFSLKPAFWRRWDSKTYIKFAEHLRREFDATSFAAESGMPVEEIQHVFDALVCNPLYRPQEAAKRAEDGMVDVFRLFNVKKYATINRPWGTTENGRKQWLGELVGVAQSEVQLVLASGNKRTLPLGDLGQDDVKYLGVHLREEDKKLLWG